MKPRCLGKYMRTSSFIAGDDNPQNAYTYWIALDVYTTLQLAIDWVVTL